MDHVLGKCGAVPSPPDPRRLVLRPAAAAPPRTSGAADYSAGWTYQTARNAANGTCVIATLSNSEAQSLALLAAIAYSPDSDWPAQLDAYRRGGASPDFDPDTGAGDRGASPTRVWQNALAGFGANRLLAYAALPPASPASPAPAVPTVAAATDCCGGCAVTINLTPANLTQTARFTFDPAPPVASHEVWVTGYDFAAKVLAFVSWGRRMEMTFEFFGRSAIEGQALLWPWHVTSGRFFGGRFDVVQFAADYAAATGRPFPTPVPAELPYDPRWRGQLVLTPDRSGVEFAPDRGWALVTGAAALTGGKIVADWNARTVYLP